MSRPRARSPSSLPPIRCFATAAFPHRIAACLPSPGRTCTISQPTSCGPRHATPRRRSLERAVRRALAGLLVALFHSVATAQLSGTASVLSDYRYRGVSLSDNTPAIQLGLAYDDPNGWYAGLFASSVRYTEPSERGVQAIYYVGHAWRTAAGPSFEAGASYSIVSGERGYDYPEVFVGFTADPVSARLYYSPRYAGYDADTLYAEVNAAQAL